MKPRFGLGSCFLVAAGLVVGCAGSPGPAPVPATRGPSESAPTPPPAAPPSVADAERALEGSRYADAERLYRALSKDDPAVRVGLARVLLYTGRHAEARAWLSEALAAQTPPDVTLATLHAEILRDAGDLDAAQRELTALASRPEARRARLLLGELLIERGRRQDAEPVLMTLIEDYNEDRVTAEDGAGLALVARAAHLLRSPHDANDAFNAAERAAPGVAETLLWRAELFLEKHDPGHAEEVVTEVLERAPDHPEALVWLAHVKLEQALDFDAARELCTRALAVNPRAKHAYFVLAGLALRDLEFKEALSLVDRGLEHDPSDLELSSMRAAVAFLAEDHAAFEAARQAVLARNPRYSRFYSIVGEYAEWEHRYERIVEMMREAVALDDEDARAHAALGLNLIRAGQDGPGVQSLRRAFAKDPFNVRVFNTLELFEQIIPKDYVSKRSGRFIIRYPKAEVALLERYVPDLLERAYRELKRAYDFTPTEPIGIELYSAREHFAVRTSGLPQTAIQGVCFGKTLASLTPGAEPFNLGMTLWHELAHVFHIQMSDSHVPRWLTEGLAEYETLVARPEWRRHHDPELYRAVRARRLPPVASMNRAFTHAEEMQDMATAYYASSQIAVMLVERFGREKVNGLLRSLGRAAPSEAIVTTALGVDAAELDRAFDAYLDRSLARYGEQFVPLEPRGELSALGAAARTAPEDVERQLMLAGAALAEKKPDVAREALALAERRAPRSPDVRFMAARLLAVEGKPTEALGALRRMIAEGQDGYAVQMAIAELTDPEKEPAQFRAALQRAHELDPSQAEPLHGLWRVARETSDIGAERLALEKLAALEEHDGSVYRRLMAILIEQKAYEQAVLVGQAAIYADIEGSETHTAYAQALAARGQAALAEFEFVSATACPSSPDVLARAHRAFAAFLEQRGDRARARTELERASALEAEASQARSP